MTSPATLAERTVWKKPVNGKVVWFAQRAAVGFNGRRIFIRAQAPLQHQAIARFEEKWKEHEAKDPLAAPLTGSIAQHLRRWLADMKGTVRDSTHERYTTSLEKQVIPHIGAVAVADLRPGHIAQLMAALKTAKASARLRGMAWTVLRQALGTRITARVYDEDTIKKRPKPPTTKIRPLTLEQTDALLAKAVELEDPRYELYATLLGTWARLGELLALDWDHFDAKAGTITIVQTLTKSGGFEEPKTKTGKRPIHLDARNLALLKKLKKQARPGPWVFGNTAGEPDSNTNITRRSFKPLLVAAKLPDIRLHDLRHTGITLALGAGVPLKVVQERAGHASPTTTLAIYGHVLPSMQKDAMSKLDALWAGPRE